MGAGFAYVYSGVVKGAEGKLKGRASNFDFQDTVSRAQKYDVGTISKDFMDSKGNKRPLLLRNN